MKDCQKKLFRGKNKKKNFFFFSKKNMFKYSFILKIKIIKSKKE
jgi:hypothetical protein